MKQCILVLLQSHVTCVMEPDESLVAEAPGLRGGPAWFKCHHCVWSGLGADFREFNKMLMSGSDTVPVLSVWTAGRNVSSSVSGCVEENK